MRSGMQQSIRIVIAALVMVAAGARSVAAQGETTPFQTTNVFALALIQGQELRAKMARLEHVVFDPAVASPEIEALRKKSNGLELILSGELAEGDRDRLQRELAEARKNLRTAVFAHPDVKRAVAELEADKAKLVELNQRILAIRQKQKEQQQQEQVPVSAETMFE